MLDVFVPGLQYFSGGVPPGAYFQIVVDDLLLIARDPKDPSPQRRGEICLLALAAYFESFCKDHAAAMLNIAPGLVSTLKSAGHETKIDATDLVEISNSQQGSVGFLIAEQLNFGAAKHINSVFLALAKVTPFARDEARRYDLLLAQRHLVAHHGGVLTKRFVDQYLESDSWAVYRNSLMQSPETIEQNATFLLEIAGKLVNRSTRALEQWIAQEKLQLDQAAQEALNLLATWRAQEQK